MKPRLRGLATLMLLLSAACSNLPEPEGPGSAPTSVSVPAAAPVAAPAAAPPSAAFDPVGNFDFTAEVQGQGQPGTLSITRGADGKLGAILVGGNNEQLQASSVVAEGRKLTIVATIPGGPEITFALTFESNDKFAGTLGLQGMSGTITGTRKKS